MSSTTLVEGLFFHLGAGTTQFEPFAAFDQLITNRTFAQFELGADLPVNTDIAPHSLFSTRRSALPSLPIMALAGCIRP
jgi:hypothetical protein